MSEKTLKSRIVHKHDIEANFKKATGFTPLAGEVVVYDPDENNSNPRVKIGDGVTNVNDLAFVTDAVEERFDEKLETKKDKDFVVAISGDGSTGYTSDKTATEIYEAYNAGKYIYAKNDSGGIYNLTQCQPAFANFEKAGVSSGVSGLFVVLSNGKVAYSGKTFYDESEVDELLALKADQTALDAVGALVGDTAVAEQISEAVAEIPQADWSQNDETAADYVKNRPFYTTDPVYTEIFNNTWTSSNFSTNTNSEGTIRSSYIYTIDSYELEEGATYKVTIDGTEYNSVKCVKASNYYSLGNLYLHKSSSYEDTGEDYLLFGFSNYLRLYLRTSEVPETISASIAAGIVEIVQLDEKYISYKPGLKVEGKVYNVKDIVDKTVTETTAGEGAEIFNTYTSAYHYAVGSRAMAINSNTQAIGPSSMSQGIQTIANGRASHSQGFGTVAYSDYQHAEGKFNIIDTENKYVHIIGNGGEDIYSNAHTLDWSGNAWYQGDVYVGGASQDDESARALAKVPTDEETVELLLEMGIAEPTASTAGAIYTDNNNVIYTL